MSWWPSFSFSLPSFSPPVSIQRTFISFLLKRSLGHLLKPGQLDVQQIDAQIGSGFVEIKHLELDASAVTTFLKDVPVRLVEGTIGSVTVRIPWPNPFTATIGMSISNLNLSLELSDPNARHMKNVPQDLTSSVASVADMFLHDELSNGEEALLRQSVHQNPYRGGGGPPGSLDPFADLNEEGHPPSNTASPSDPEGISIFAGLFEGLLARFELNMTNTCVKLIHEGNAHFNFCISQLEYFTTRDRDERQSSAALLGEQRSLRISGLKLSIQESASTKSGPPLSTPSHLTKLSPDSSDSELDEETNLLMSQSLISLPPRMGTSFRHPPLSPSFSTISHISSESSMYQSAFSESRMNSRPSSPSTNSALEKIEGHDEVLLLIPDPISITLTTPPPYVASEDLSSTLRNSTDAEKKSGDDSLRLQVLIGIVTLTLRARHVKAMMTTVDAVRKMRLESSESKPSMSPTVFNRLDVSASVKGIVCIAPDSNTETSVALECFDAFYARPLAPPDLKCGYVRLYIDTLQIETLNTCSSSRSHIFDRKVSCTVSDFSIVAFHAPSSDQRHQSSPVLITDQQLSLSYAQEHQRPSDHIHPRTTEQKAQTLPSFEILDWTTEKGRSHGASLRPWRMKYTASAANSRVSKPGVNPGSVSGAVLSTSSESPQAVGLEISARLVARNVNATAFKIDLCNEGSSASQMHLEIAPLHVFLELRLLSSVLLFANAAGLGQAETHPEGSPLRSANEKALSVKSTTRTEHYIQDLMDYSDDDSVRLLSCEENSRTQDDVTTTCVSKKSPHVHDNMNVELHVSLIRLEMRAPPAASYTTRSGSFVIDLHDLRFVSNSNIIQAKKSKPHVGFENLDEEWYADWTGRETTIWQVERIVCAYAATMISKAKAFVSLGPAELNPDNHLLPYPSLLILSSSLSNSQSTIRKDNATAKSPATLMFRVPSAHVDLSKDMVDNLQLWADDASQWLAKLDGSLATSTSDSTSPSVIGSKFFNKRSENGLTESEIASNELGQQSEVVIKIAVINVFIRLNMPAVSEGIHSCRALDTTITNVDTLVEVKPQGKDETAITLSIMTILVEDSASDVSRVLIETRQSDMKPSVKLRFHAINVPQTKAKESKIRLTLHCLTANASPDLEFVKDVVAFIQAPPGAFETVVPSERTQLYLNISESSIHISPLSQTSAIVFSLSDFGLSTVLIGNSSTSAVNILGGGISLFLADDFGTPPKPDSSGRETEHWETLGYAFIAGVENFKIDIQRDNMFDPVDFRVDVNGLNLDIHLCADTISGISNVATAIQSEVTTSALGKEPSDGISEGRQSLTSSSSTGTGPSNLLKSLDEYAFRKIPEIGPLPDMVGDDLPSNPEYLDSSFGAAAGLRPLDDDELDEFSPEEIKSEDCLSRNGISQFGGETIKMLQPTLNVIENYYDALPPGSLVDTQDYGETSACIRLRSVNCRLLLYDGYDREKTRATIQEEVKRVKRRLAKIRQLLASGQTYDPTVDEVNTLLFNSVYVGLDQEAEDLEAGELIAKIDEELLDDQTDLRSESSWQSFKPDVTSSSRPRSRSQGFVARSKQLSRARASSVEFSLQGIDAEFDQYRSKTPLASRLLFTVRDVEILDHMKTSTWSTFLTQMRSDSRGNIREADSNMIRVELQMIRPNTTHSNEEARLKAKLLPLRLHVDQDALDFLKKFFSFSDTIAAPSPPVALKDEIYFQHAEVFPVDIKLDYKPRRVDYRALKEGKTIELMNFFHFDGAEMTLRHITLKGITGWPRFFDSLNDLWTPDVKANQLVDVISGVSPIRSAVNVGSGIADLVLLPIAQYKKDGRVIRGLQKGTKAFVKSTAMEAIKLGAQLATGTQVVLEQAESFLGVRGEVTAETLHFLPGIPIPPDAMSDNEESDSDLISRYAEQPRNIKEGVQSASKAIAKNLKVAGQTILAVPMEVYERSNTEGPARAVIRAVPIAVLKPMIGASEAVSKTLLGLRNTLDPTIPIDSEVKYKHR